MESTVICLERNAVQGYVYACHNIVMQNTGEGAAMHN
jgi:hypothetical protein